MLLTLQWEPSVCHATPACFCTAPGASCGLSSDWPSDCEKAADSGPETQRRGKKLITWPLSCHASQLVVYG
jgi:hypothetical protein